MFSLQHATNNIWYGNFSIFPQDAVTHAISTRFNGQSSSPYNGLNLALHVGDKREAVIANRRRFCEALGVDAAKMTTCQQVHGSNVAKITAANIGAGAFSLEDTIADTDALITDVRQVPLTLFFADCTPIMLYDPEHHAVGIAHGGWRGTVGAIALRMVNAMAQEFATNPSSCLASIGPAIGACCYEVGNEVAEQFTAVFKDTAPSILQQHTQSDKYQLNLWQANALMLLKAGLRPENIELADTCTSCNSDIFFSYRADKGTTGRIAALIALK